MANQTSLLKDSILKLLSNNSYKKEHVIAYADYCQKLANDPKNTWATNKPDTEYAKGFKFIDSQGLVFDGKHITWQSTGISFDYIAYKNKMLLAYPESKIDVQVVLKDDMFTVSKESGKVIYEHKITNPFADPDKNINGAYCVIKNNRGEFLTTVSKEEIEKHKKSAKTQYIWNAWFKEMVLKTVIKKACKMHFDDVYESMIDLDNENEDIDTATDLINKEKNNELLNPIEEKLKSAKTLAELKTAFETLTGEQKVAMENLKNELKTKLK